MHPDSRFEASPDVRARQLDDEMVLLDLAAGQYYSLNRAGTEVWHAVVRGASLAEVKDGVAGKWPVDEPERWRLIREVVGDLVGRGLLRAARD